MSSKLTTPNFFPSLIDQMRKRGLSKRQTLKSFTKIRACSCNTFSAADKVFRIVDVEKTETAGVKFPDRLVADIQNF